MEFGFDSDLIKSEAFGKALDTRRASLEERGVIKERCMVYGIGPYQNVNFSQIVMI